MPPWKVLPNQRGEGGRSEEGEAGGEVGEGSFGWVRGGIRACILPDDREQFGWWGTVFK